MNPVKRNANHDADKAMTIRFSVSRTALLLSAALLLGACACAARADENPAEGAGADVSRLVEEVLRKAGGNGEDALSEWTRSIIERALERAGEAARRTGPGGSGDGVTSAAPLPAERHATEIAGGATARNGAAEILIFTSLSVPAESWRQWAHDAAAVGAPLVLRGVGEGGLRETAKEIGARLGGAEAGVAIDPRLFRLFGIERVPAVVVVPSGGPGRSPVPPCESRGCADDPAPPHDLVSGNIGLAAALETVADEGAVGREAALSHLQRLRGEKQR